MNTLAEAQADKKVTWKVGGMTCANCALSVSKTLEKKGLQQIKVNAITGDVSFASPANQSMESEAMRSVENLGYTVHTEATAQALAHHDHDHGRLSSKLIRFLVCLPFTALLMVHMIPGVHLHALMNPWVQFGLALPVFLIGMYYFGKSAVKSLQSGIANMDVLIALGALAAFSYSVYGLFTSHPQDFLFFETAASIITIVFFGNWLEDYSIEQTQKEFKKLLKQEIVPAHMITYDSGGTETLFEVDSNSLKVGDLLMIRTGEQVPADSKILHGEVEVSEALLSGESIPVFRKKGETLVGGSIIVNGNAKVYVTATGKNTVLSSIQEMMKNAQSEKPPVQKLADRISAIFIPFVVGISVLTLIGNLTLGGHPFSTSLLRSIAVLVVACPCAMGLATPAAIAVGLGRAARYGILYADTSRIELFKNIRQIVFDKTGTLTTGKFAISGYRSFLLGDEEFKQLVFSIEKFSAHPIAKSIAQAWQVKNALRMQQVQEIKGEGMSAQDAEGNQYRIGSAKILKQPTQEPHHLYLTKNGDYIGWIDIADEYRPEAKQVIGYFKQQGIKTILLSGDSIGKCRQVAEDLKIDQFYAEKTPAQKLEIMDALVQASPTVMVGDGINDAPALAKATISVSLSEASQMAIQSASVILTQGGLRELPRAMQLGRLTYGTVKSNLAWAFLYNLVAIPVAALGYLHPTFGALLMGGSDVVLAINSLYLGVRKLV